MRSLIDDGKIERLCNTFREGYGVAWTKGKDPFIVVTTDLTTKDGTCIMVAVHNKEAFVLTTTVRTEMLTSKKFYEYQDFYMEQLEEDNNLCIVDMVGEPTQIGRMLFDDQTLIQIQNIGILYKSSVSYKK